MNRKNIRSEYIKNLVAERENIGKMFEENTKQAIKDILAESLPAGIKSIIAEAEKEKAENQEPEVEEVEEPEVEVLNTEEGENQPTETSPAEEEAKQEEESTEQAPVEEPSEEVEIQEPETEPEKESADDEEMLAAIEDLKGEDGEYDLTGMSDEDFVKVMKVVKPADGVRIVKDCENNTITLTDEENDTEYIIELDDVCDNECEQEKISECMLKKPVGMGFGSKRELEKPFSVKANIKEEEDVFEIEIEDEPEKEPIDIENVEMPEESMEGKHYGKAMPQQKSASKRNGYDRRGLPYQMKNEDIERKVNEIMEENKQLKKIASQIKEQLKEEAVINSSLANIVKLIVENTTSRDEKIQIIKRFDNVKTMEEGKSLYESISRELNSEKVGETANAKMNATLTEAVGEKTSMVKTALYESEDLSRTRDLMKRMGL